MEAHGDGDMFDGRFTLIKLDYAEARKHGTGYVVGRDLAAGGHLWRIDFYPFGLANDAHNDENTSVLLFKLKSNPRGVVRAVVEAFFFAAGPDDAMYQHPFTSLCDDQDVHAFRAGKQGCPVYLERSDVEALHSTYGRVTVTCGILVLGDDGSIPVPPSDVGTNVARLLDSPAGTDVAFSVGGETFRAHRAVLAARSPVFHAQLFGPMADATAPSITVQGIEPAVFRLMLRFIYKDALPGDGDGDAAALGDSPVETMQQLLVAADRYALDRLKLLCARWLWDNISVDTFASTLVCAETFNCPELKSRCIDFFADDDIFRRIVFTEGFMWLHKFPALVAKLKERVGRETQPSPLGNT